MNDFKVPENISKILIEAGSHDKDIALKAQQEIALSVEAPLRHQIRQALSLFKSVATEPVNIKTEIDWQLKYCRDCRWDIIGLGLDVLRENVLRECVVQKVDKENFNLLIVADPTAHNAHRFKLIVEITS